MGNSGSINSNILLNFEDMQDIIKTHTNYIIINTLPENQQECLITHSLNASQEESVINNCIQKRKTDTKIIVYGQSSNDESIRNKYRQLTKLGFTQVYIYTAGLFEWLLLQDIYGADEFPTTKKELDILKYKACKTDNYKY